MRDGASSDAGLSDRSGQTVDITPAPKILKVLGNIAFEPWQCIAELIDNSFDEFLELQREGTGLREPLAVEVSLPATRLVPRHRAGEAFEWPSAREGLVAAETRAIYGVPLDSLPKRQRSRRELETDAVVVVEDNGRGMSLDRVTEAARAGRSSHDPFSNLGLFGMGFNVATARLGNTTRLLTTREGDPDWVGIEIDLTERMRDYEAPVIRRPKTSPSEHGTRVEISALNPIAEALIRPANQSKLRETLGGIYSFLLEKQGFGLTVNEVPVHAIRHCVWSAARSVTRGKEEIPAVIEIDEPLSDRAVCHACQTWQDLEWKRCDECGSTELEIRERRVWGWLGIQRYLDPKEFGVDFLRNGRKILRFDKTPFEWRDPDDPGRPGDVEYPIELAHQGGRIVGEIHLDHVRVNYLKDNFETSDLGWRKAVEIVRGRGPLLPRLAKQLQYEQNNSPLARLHRGYRRNDPGAAYLMPGNGKTVIDTREWGRRFQGGDPEYQTDQRWWDAVLRHDELVAEAKRAEDERMRAAEAALGDPTEEFRRGPEIRGDTEKVAPPAAPLTEAERIERLLAAARPMPELDGEFSVPGVAGRPMRISAYQVVGHQVENAEGKRTPVWLAPQRGGSFAAVVDLGHPHFSLFDDDPADMVLTELAQHLITRARGSAPPISAVVAALKDRYLASRTIDRNRLVALASQTMSDLQERMPECVLGNPERPWLKALSDPERHITEDRIVGDLRVADIDGVIQDGTYLRYVPGGVIPRVVEEWPEAFFDGRLFRSPYAEIDSPTARRHTVASVTGYLNDVAWLAAAPPAPRREQLIRARLSLELLPEELAPEG